MPFLPGSADPHIHLITIYPGCPLSTKQNGGLCLEPPPRPDEAQESMSVPPASTSSVRLSVRLLQHPLCRQSRGPWASLVCEGYIAALVPPPASDPRLPGVSPRLHLLSQPPPWDSRPTPPSCQAAPLFSLQSILHAYSEPHLRNATLLPAPGPSHTLLPLPEICIYFSTWPTRIHGSNLSLALASSRKPLFSYTPRLDVVVQTPSLLCTPLAIITQLFEWHDGPPVLDICHLCGHPACSESPPTCEELAPVRGLTPVGKTHLPMSVTCWCEQLYWRPKRASHPPVSWSGRDAAAGCLLHRLRSSPKLPETLCFCSARHEGSCCLQQGALAHTLPNQTLSLWSGDVPELLAAVLPGSRTT